MLYLFNDLLQQLNNVPLMLFPLLAIADNHLM